MNDKVHPVASLGSFRNNFRAVHKICQDPFIQDITRIFHGWEMKLKGLVPLTRLNTKRHGNQMVGDTFNFYENKNAGIQMDIANLDNGRRLS